MRRRLELLREGDRQDERNLRPLVILAVCLDKAKNYFGVSWVCEVAGPLEDMGGPGRTRLVKAENRLNKRTLKGFRKI